MIARYDLERSLLDTTWKVNRYIGPYTTGAPLIEICNNNLYIAFGIEGNLTIDGITRSKLFRANKHTGAISTFNSKVQTTSTNGVKLNVIGNSIYYLQNDNISSALRLYVITDGKDSFRQRVEIKGIPTFGVQKGFDGMPILPNELTWYDISKVGRSYNSKLKKFQNGMNNYPGTFTLNNSNSSVFYNYKDSIYYLFETQSNTAVNMLGEMGNYYRVNRSINEVKKLNFITLRE